MIRPSEIVVTKIAWDDLWQRYRVLIGGTIEALGLEEHITYRLMQDFERLKGELETGQSYWEWQRDRLDAIYRRRANAGKENHA